MQIRREKNQSTLFADDMKLNINDHVTYIEKLLDLMNSFSSGSGSKITSQKS